MRLSLEQFAAAQVFDGHVDTLELFHQMTVGMLAPA